MQFNVAQLLSGPVGAVRHRTVSGDLTGADGRAPAHITGAVEVMRTDRGVLVRGELSATVDLECVKCLNGFEEAIEVALEEEYISAHQAGKVERRSLQADNLLIDSNNLLDLEPALKEYASLNTPIKPVCRPDCPGLCQRCGAELAAARACAPPPSHPRLPASRPCWRSTGPLEKGNGEPKIVMGALPKRKTSKSRRNKRRGHDKVSTPPLVECTRCRSPRLQHHVCYSCGTLQRPGDILGVAPPAQC